MNKKKAKKSKEKKAWFQFVVKAFGVLCALGVVLVVGMFVYFAKDLPDPNKVNKRFIAQSTKIYDRTGEVLLYEIHGEEKRTLISFSEMPKSVKYSTIVSEDQGFYSHHGIKFTSIARAVIKDIFQLGAAQGGSTITQQFVKNSILTSEKTLTRKIKEVILSIEIEQKFEKNEILRMYLNEIPYGSNAYGIEAAAQTFFAKNAKDLTYDEAALLAILPRATTFFSPYGSHLERLKYNQEVILDKMASLGYITQQEADVYKGVDVLDKVVSRKDEMKAPHFVMYIKEYLEEKYGDEKIEQEGLNVYTTLDWTKQEIAEKVVKEGAERNLKNYNAENAALVAIDAKTSQILAMVGSKDYFDKSIDGQVNVAIRERQPGSSFKPYVYLTAFTKGYTPETVIFDVETDFDTEEDESYEPQNYDGKFHGPVKMKNSLGMSLNIPAVKTLYLAGVRDSINMAKRLGITSLNEPDRYGLSLVLGGGEVKLLDHVNAYASIANEGVFRNKTAILKIENSEGDVIEEFKNKKGERVVEKEHIAMLDHILSTNKYRAPAFGENNPFKFTDRQVSAKTGTTNEYRDGWAIGYTPSIAVGVWAGNNDNRAMRAGAAGANVAAPIWRSFMNQVLDNYNIEEFPEYEKEEDIKSVLMGELDIEKDVEICEIPEKKNKYCLANKYCRDEDVKNRHFANVHNILWYVNRKDPRGEFPENPKNDSQFKKWEKGVEKWYDDNDDDEMRKYIFGEKPEDECSQSEFSKHLPKMSMSVQKTGNRVKISANVDANYGVKNVKFYVDDSEIASKSGGPYETTYEIPVDKNGSTLKVEVKLTDDNDNEAKDSQSVSGTF
ncbi:penicillin-binding protein [Patescibacteria group bacterium]